MGACGCPAESLKLSCCVPRDAPCTTHQIHLLACRSSSAHPSGQRKFLHKGDTNYTKRCPLPAIKASGPKSVNGVVSLCVRCMDCRLSLLIVHSTYLHAGMPN